jgi:hypothetical protein
VADEISVARAKGWRSPVNALMLMSVANYLSFATWNALHTNFAIDAVQFDGTDMGILHTVREIPGFLSFAAVLFLIIMREQTLGLVSLAVIGGGVAMTGLFPTPLGFYTTTLRRFRSGRKSCSARAIGSITRWSSWAARGGRSSSCSPHS